MQKIKYKLRIKPAFSLVEMLMALLVASLLLAALAPVMTRKMNEHVTVSGTGNGIKSDYSRIFYEDFEWNVPPGVNVIKVTSVGGGGAGGGATYGYKEITSSETDWTVPEGVTKLRVFMIGAGGGGASGGLGTHWEYGDIPNTTETYDDYLNLGETKVEKFPKSGYGAPELDSRCKASGETRWTYVNDETIKVPPGGVTGSTIKVTACGGGGGGAHATYGYGGGGGSGGFLSNKNLTLTSQAIYIKIGGGGNSGTESCYSGGNGNSSGSSCNGISGGAGSSSISSTNSGNVAAAGNGSYGTQNLLLAAGGRGAQAKSGNFYAGNGGYGSIWAAGGGGGYRYLSSSTAGAGYGGGGPTTISTLSGAIDDSIIFQAGGGGGGGGCGVEYTGIAAAGGGAGGGGGYGGGGGGGGAGTYSGAGGAGGKSLNALVGGGQGNSGQTGYETTSVQGRGGAGGGGYGGASGSYNSPGIIPAANNIFGSERCNGGKGGGRGTSCQDGSALCASASGKPGALRMYYGGAGKKDVFKCQYYTKSNSGGGGGAGQIWIGELSVTPGQKLNFNIGIGGNRTNSYGSNGNDGGSTSITNNSGAALISVSGGKGGKYESDETYINSSYGIGGGIKTSNVDSSSAKYVNWKKTNFHNGGENGGNGRTPDNGAGGGKGGQLYNLDGVLLKGGLEGGAQSDGGDALITNYGAGGGGGGGVINDGGTPGYGGKGANGYIYVEWGKTNGGGGASGQIVTENTVWVTPATKIQITVGKGGEPKDAITNNGQLGQKGNDGGESFVTTNEGKKAVAKGGEGGYPGTASHGKGGNYDGKDENGNVTGDKSPNYIENSIKGENGTDDYGGIGGTITEEICPLFDTLMGLGGCGGNMPNGNCNGASSTGAGKNAGKVGGGGGGGAVKDNTAYTGGKGANGMVVIEWNN